MSDENVVKTQIYRTIRNVSRHLDNVCLFFFFSLQLTKYGRKGVIRKCAAIVPLIFYKIIRPSWVLILYIYIFSNIIRHDRLSHLSVLYKNYYLCKSSHDTVSVPTFISIRFGHRIFLFEKLTEKSNAVTSYDMCYS